MKQYFFSVGLISVVNFALMSFFALGKVILSGSFGMDFSGALGFCALFAFMSFITSLFSAFILYVVYWALLPLKVNFILFILVISLVYILIKYSFQPAHNLIRELDWIIFPNSDFLIMAIDVVIFWSVVKRPVGSRWSRSIGQI